MAAAAASSSVLLLLRSQPPSPSPSHSSSSSLISSILKPLLLSSNALSPTRLRQIHVPPLHKPLFGSFFSTTTPSSSSVAFPHPPPLAAVAGSSAQETVAAAAEEEDEEDEEEDGVDGELEQFDDDEETDSEGDDLETEGGELEDAQVGGSTSSPLVEKRKERLKLEIPSLTVKEKKELASFAHSLGKKLKSQLVGKSGVTSNLATSFIETLEANELLKIKIHRTCPGELEDAVKQLEELTGSVTVSQIGRTLIIYKPSLTKLKAEEKKKQVRNLILKKQFKPRVFNKSKEPPKSSRPGSTWKRRDSR